MIQHICPFCNNSLVYLVDIYTGLLINSNQKCTSCQAIIILSSDGLRKYPILQAYKTLNNTTIIINYTYNEVLLKSPNKTTTRRFNDINHLSTIIKKLLIFS